MRKIETTTREYDAQGNVVKETTVTETIDTNICTLPHYPQVSPNIPHTPPYVLDGTATQGRF